jgi:hypothetical protein
MPIWEDSQTGCSIKWTGNFRFTVTRNGRTVLTAHMTSGFELEVAERSATGGD